MSVFDKNTDKHLRVGDESQPECRMLVGEDPKDKSKHILWHSYDKVYGDTILAKGKGLYINGVMSHGDYNCRREGETKNAWSSNSTCVQAITNNSDVYAINDGYTPPVIIYEPKECYTEFMDHAKNETASTYWVKTDGTKVPLYSVKEQYFLNNLSSSASHYTYFYDYQVGGSQFGFNIYGSKCVEDVKIGNINNSITGVTAGTLGLFNIKKNSTTGKYDVTINTENGKLPGEIKNTNGDIKKEGNIIAIFKISSETDERFKQSGTYTFSSGKSEGTNCSWHFHLGFIFYDLADKYHDSNPAFMMCTHGRSWIWNCSIDNVRSWQSPVLYRDKLDSQNYDTPRSGSFTSKYDPKDNSNKKDNGGWTNNDADIPEENKWYELCVDLDRLRDGNFYESDTTQVLGKYRWKNHFIYFRPASKENIEKWCGTGSEGDTMVQTAGDVKYTPESISYDFNIKVDGSKVANKEMSLSNATNLATNIQTTKEKYETIQVATSQQASNGYNYTPYKDLILEIDKDSDNPTIFNASNPINIVYYSGCNFITYNTI